MIDAALFWRLVAALGQQGREDLEWSESVAPPVDAEAFALEVAFVICNSGMKNTVAAGIFRRCRAALEAGTPVADVFKHPGKAAAIERVWANREAFFLGWCAAVDRLAYLESLPWIGGVTKYHLAKNFGMPFAKPDVHLVRLADREGCSPQQLCERLAGETGLKVATVDTLLWRACAVGVLDSPTGRVRL